MSPPAPRSSIRTLDSEAHTADTNGVSVRVPWRSNFEAGARDPLAAFHAFQSADVHRWPLVRIA